MAQTAKDVILRLLDEGYDRRAWHGPTLRGALRGVTAAQAAWRASPRTHNIWELTVHAAYWKYAVRRMLTGEKRGSFALKGSNWFVRPLPEAEAGGTSLQGAWQDDLQLLADAHRKLRATIQALRPEALGAKAHGKPYSNAFVLRGIAAHDLYHAGQIQLLKRLGVTSSAIT